MLPTDPKLFKTSLSRFVVITNSNCPIYSVLADEAADCGNKEQMMKDLLSMFIVKKV